MDSSNENKPQQPTTDGDARGVVPTPDRAMLKRFLGGLSLAVTQVVRATGSPELGFLVFSAEALDIMVDELAGHIAAGRTEEQMLVHIRADIAAREAEDPQRVGSAREFLAEGKQRMDRALDALEQRADLTSLPGAPKRGGGYLN